MGKKLKKRRPSGWAIAPARVDRWLDDAQTQMAAEDFERAVVTCRRILSYVPSEVPQRVMALRLLGIAYAMLRQFEESYQVMSEAVEASPNDPDLWHNRGVLARTTFRVVQSVLDLERAVALEGTGEWATRFSEELAIARDMLEAERAMRGPDFTVEQLAEQQELHRLALNDMMEKRWTEAEARLRRVIAMGDVLPQPWSNLGMALMMQRRFDEAEAAQRRALEIDPDYRLAQDHLRDLVPIRESGQLPEITTMNPLASAPVTQSFRSSKS